MSTKGFGLESSATASAVLKYVAVVGVMFIATPTIGTVPTTVPNLPEKTTLLSDKTSLSNPYTGSLRISHAPPEKQKKSQRVPLGKRLMALRQKAIEDGLTLLTTDEILAEVKHRRGEI